MDIFTPVFNKRELGKALKKAQKGVVAYITELCKEDEDAAKELANALTTAGEASVTVDGATHTITSSMISFKMCVLPSHCHAQLWCACNNV